MSGGLWVWPSEDEVQGANLCGREHYYTHGYAPTQVEVLGI